ncbi:MAG TPA: hypothetical protein VMA83_07300 [Solirubrobacteraceae bacterium]|nr:hypothetical protein [Solirubrobacteraceae bacterium]
MIRSLRLITLPIAAAAAFALAVPALAAAEEPQVAHYTKEAQSAYEEQLKSHEISEAKINKRDHDILIVLKNGEKVFIHLKPHEVEAIEAALRAKGVHYTVESAEEAKKEVGSKPVHHKLRYIIGGVVIVLVIVAIGYYFFDRKRKSEME